MPTSINWRFAATIALPLLLTVAGVFALTFDLINRVSVGANTADAERTRDIVLSAMAAADKHVADTASDNAYWNDAVRYAYGTPDVQWVMDTWGVPSKDGINYDVVEIVDRQKDAPVLAFRAGEPLTEGTAQYFGGKLDALLARLPQDFTTQGSVATIMRTTDGLALVGAAPIQPSSASLVPSVAKPRYLIFAKFLSNDFVSAIARQYVVAGLAISEKPGSGTPILDVTGDPIAYATWIDRRPGDAATRTVIGKAAIILGFMALVIFGIGALCWRLLHAAAAREARAQHDALHDILTGLPNRAALMSWLDHGNSGSAGPIALTFTDLDGFKEINDTYGHAVGDRLIQAVSVGIRYLAGDKGRVCRFGGDEFVALFEGEDATLRARQFADNVILFLAQPFTIEGRLASVGASIGIAAMPAGEAVASELLRRADIAMYQAKEGGKNRACLFDPGLDAERQEARAIASELRAIIAAGTIGVHFQPVVNATNRLIVGVEALARWPENSARQVAPDRFIRVAETSGLIEELGFAVMTEACRHASQWPGVRLSINISPLQLRNADFVARSVEIITASGMACCDVEFEITESVMLADVEGTREVFNRLRAAGIGIALDDFGTGFSSIGYLRQFAFDRIKIDRSLVSRILDGRAEQAIVQGTTLMAQGMTALITAEGVESEDQVDLLRMTGCTELQGFYFSKPVPPETVNRLLAERIAMPRRAERPAA